jgi:hypothetical protein
MAAAIAPEAQKKAQAELDRVVGRDRRACRSPPGLPSIGTERIYSTVIQRYRRAAVRQRLRQGGHAMATSLVRRCASFRDSVRHRSWRAGFQHATIQDLTYVRVRCPRALSCPSRHYRVATGSRRAPLCASSRSVATGTRRGALAQHRQPLVHPPRPQSLARARRLPAGTLARRLGRGQVGQGDAPLPIRLRPADLRRAAHRQPERLDQHRHDALGL